MSSNRELKKESKKTRVKGSENHSQSCTCMDNVFRKVANLVLGESYEKKKTFVKGKVVLTKKNVLDFNDLGASVLDRAHELFGHHISIQFISATHAGHDTSIRLNTHAVIEPFVIATNRQLSVLHPINKLLHPHFRDTMNINAAARNVLINSKGVLERTFFTGKYSIELSFKIYKDWEFPNQALPVDLVLRQLLPDYSVNEGQGKKANYFQPMHLQPHFFTSPLEQDMVSSPLEDQETKLSQQMTLEGDKRQLGYHK